MAVIKEYQSGNTAIKIFDDYMAKTPEEIKWRDERVTKIAWEIVLRARAQGIDI